MVSKSFSLLFYLKKPENYVEGKQFIYLRITIDFQRLDLSTHRECEPDRWNGDSGRLNGTKEEVRSLNVYLDSLKAKVYEAQRSLLDKNEPINVGNLKRKLRGVTERPRMVLEIFRFHNKKFIREFRNTKPEQVYIIRSILTPHCRRNNKETPWISAYSVLKHT